MSGWSRYIFWDSPAPNAFWAAHERWKLPTFSQSHWPLHSPNDRQLSRQECATALERKCHQDDCSGHNWSRWRQASASPVMTKAATLTTFPFLRGSWWGKPQKSTSLATQWLAENRRLRLTTPPCGDYRRYNGRGYCNNKAPFFCLFGKKANKIEWCHSHILVSGKNKELALKLTSNMLHSIEET